MRKKIALVGVAIVILIAAMWFAADYGDKKAKEDVVVLTLSKGVLHRKIDSLKPHSENILPEEVYKFVVLGDTVYGLPYENSAYGYFSYVLSKKDYDVRSKDIQEAQGIALVPGGQISIQDKSDTSIKFFTRSHLQRLVRLRHNVWRAIPAGNNVIYNAEVNGKSYFYLANVLTGQVRDSISVAKLFGLNDDQDVAMLTTGYFQPGKTNGLVNYVINKAGMVVEFDVESFHAPRLLTTIDSIGFPRIVTEAISPGTTQRVPKPELAVNASVASLKNCVYVLSRISDSKNSGAHIIDVYDGATLQYISSLGLGNDQMQPIELFADTAAGLLWVLFDDRQTLKSFSVK